LKKAFFNGRIFSGDTFLNKKAVLTKNGIIQDIVNETDIPPGYEMHDLFGNIMAPAFIDLQIYGGTGHLFTLNPSVESLKGIYNYCQSGGTHLFQATVATNSLEVMLKAIEAAKEYRALGLPGLLGIHLEGPYINPKKKGAHLEHFIRQPTVEEINLILKHGEGIVTMITLAPEMCDENILKLLQESGIKISIGHSNATYKEAIKFFENGIKTATHLFNAMSPFQSREPGLVGAIFDNTKVYSSIVADGIHVDFSAVRISKKILKNRLFLITDAVETNEIGDYVYIRKNDRYVTQDGTLAGSTLTMMSAVRNCIEHIGINLKESLRMASTYPALVMSLDKEIGKIQNGYQSKMVIFNDQFIIKEIISE